LIEKQRCITKTTCIEEVSAIVVGQAHNINFSLKTKVNIEFEEISDGSGMIPLYTVTVEEL
jgi:hypothetical protein